MTDLFGGENGEQGNALMEALKLCAKDCGMDIYTYLEDSPKTSLVVELVDKLNEIGYEISKRQT